MLVFLTGEREIHDTADFLRRRQLRDTEVLPLYARLSSAEQHRIFQPHRGRRIVLATNVAETSITVPGVRSVVDAGTARISRYSRRLKVQRLPIEPISQASADQRAGRCGRVAPGICIRLYTEDDYVARPEFTEPEILRTNLASVILQMTAIGLGDVASFPFVEPPDARVDPRRLPAARGARRDRATTIARLTDGRPPARPPAGRPAARADGARGRAPRLRPRGARDRRRAVDPGPARAARGAASRRPTPLHRASTSRAATCCRSSPCGTTCASSSGRCRATSSAGCAAPSSSTTCACASGRTCSASCARSPATSASAAGAEAGHPDHVHQSVLAGLLSHIGMRDGERREFRGARGSTFAIARGSVLAQAPPRWVMAAELVETNRLWARRVAAIEPAWAERLGAHLVQRSYGEPRWDERRGAAVTTETVTLYGLPIVSGRTVPYDRVDRPRRRRCSSATPSSRASGSTHHALRRPQRGVPPSACEALEARVRRAGLLDDDELFDFYDDRVGPPTSTSGRRFDQWWKAAGVSQPALLDLTDDVLGRRRVPHLADYPDTWRHGDLVPAAVVPLRPRRAARRRQPCTSRSPRSTRSTTTGFDWQIPGHRAELVEALVRTLPKDVRRAADPDDRDGAGGVGAARPAAGPARRRPGRGVAARSAGVAVPAGDVRPGGRAGAPADEHHRRRRRRHGPRRRRRPRRDPAPAGADGPRGDRRRRADRRAAGHRRRGTSATLPQVVESAVGGHRRHAATRRCSTTTTACRCAC